MGGKDTNGGRMLRKYTRLKRTA